MHISIPSILVSLWALHFQADGVLLGVRLTRHHVCLLSQLAGQIYGVFGSGPWWSWLPGLLRDVEWPGDIHTTTTTTARLQRVAPVPQAHCCGAQP
ncbi:unnamed protein product [Boreogadus saida]